MYEQQLTQDEGGKTHCKELRGRNFIGSSYYCHVCQDSYTSLKAKLNSQGNLEGRVYRRKKNNSQFKNSKIHSGIGLRRYHNVIDFMS